jgi:hypothetical protein
MHYTSPDMSRGEHEKIAVKTLFFRRLRAEEEKEKTRVCCGWELFLKPLV